MSSAVRRGRERSPRDRQYRCWHRRREGLTADVLKERERARRAAAETGVAATKRGEAALLSAAKRKKLSLKKPMRARRGKEKDGGGVEQREKEIASAFRVGRMEEKKKRRRQHDLLFEERRGTLSLPEDRGDAPGLPIIKKGGGERQELPARVAIRREKRSRRFWEQRREGRRRALRGGGGKGGTNYFASALAEGNHPKRALPQIYRRDRKGDTASTRISPAPG